MSNCLKTSKSSVYRWLPVAHFRIDFAGNSPSSNFKEHIQIRRLEWLYWLRSIGGETHHMNPGVNKENGTNVMRKPRKPKWQQRTSEQYDVRKYPVVNMLRRKQGRRGPRGIMQQLWLYCQNLCFRRYSGETSFNPKWGNEKVQAKLEKLRSRGQETISKVPSPRWKS